MGSAIVGSAVYLASVVSRLQRRASRMDISGSDAKVGWTFGSDAKVTCCRASISWLQSIVYCDAVLLLVLLCSLSKGLGGHQRVL